MNAPRLLSPPSHADEEEDGDDDLEGGERYSWSCHGRKGKRAANKTDVIIIGEHFQRPSRYPNGFGSCSLVLFLILLILEILG